MGCCETGVTRRRSCLADFFHQALQFSLARRIRGVKGSGAIAGRVRGIFVGVEAVAHPELVAQRIGAGGHQTAVLTFPAEAPNLHFDSNLACFQHRSTDNCARDSQVDLALLFGVSLDVAAMNGFDVTISQ